MSPLYKAVLSWVAINEDPYTLGIPAAVVREILLEAHHMFHLTYIGEAALPKITPYGLNELHRFSQNNQIN